MLDTIIKELHTNKFKTRVHPKIRLNNDTLVTFSVEVRLFESVIGYIDLLTDETTNHKKNYADNNQLMYMVLEDSKTIQPIIEQLIQRVKGVNPEQEALFYTLPERRQRIIKRQQQNSLTHPAFQPISKGQTRVADYKPFNTSDASSGVTCSVYVTYCPYNCLNCYNKIIQAYDPEGRFGMYTQEWEDKIVNDVGNKYNTSLTLVGGEPFLNAPTLIDLCRRVKNANPDKTIWAYTGYRWEDLMTLPLTDSRRELLHYIDVIVDSQYIDELRDESQLQVFRGSSNQRLVLVQESLYHNDIILHRDNWKRY